MASVGSSKLVHTLLMVLLCSFLLPLISTVVSEAATPATNDGVPVEDLMILAESDFLWDDDKWTVRGNASDFQHGNRMIKAADDGNDVWYFVAPGKFSGAKRAAYGGKLSFKHGFFEYNSEGRDVQRDPFDVVLISEPYELVIGYRNLYPAWDFRSEHSIDLVESAGWISNSTGEPPSRPDMVRVFTKLSAIWIRGGMYHGHEDAYLMSVILRAGPADSKPKSSSLKSQKVHSPEPRLPSDFEESLPTKEELNEKISSRSAPPPPPPQNDDEDAPPPPPVSDDDDLPPLDSDLDDPPAGKTDDKKKSGMFGSLFGGKKGKSDEL